MATPVLRAAREALPGARIIAACRPGIDELLAGSPWLDETVVGETKSLTGIPGLARRLRRQGAEAALLLPNSFRSALIARLAGVPRRVGFRRYGRGPLLSHALEPAASRTPVSTLGFYARLAELAFGCPPIDTRMELGVTEAERIAAGRLLEGVPRPYVVLCPGANKAPKRWPAQRFAAVADALSDRHGVAAVVTGSPGERGLAGEVVAAARHTVHDLVERGITIGGLKAVIDGAQLMVTNDTGPRHIAAALGTPVVTLFGPTDHRWTAIDCPHERLLVADPFLPQELVADDRPRHCLITRIPAADVLSAAERLLAGSPPAAPQERGASPEPTSAG
jgi:heptosyltransferase-2